MKVKFRKICYRVILLTVGILVPLAIGEFALRRLYPPPFRYFIWPPNTNWIFDPAPGIMPGIAGESRFITNSGGIRAEKLPDDRDDYILALGGSTTECLYLDQEETWPHLLQERLNLSGKQCWVGIAGKSGLSSKNNVMHMKYLLPQFPQTDIVLALVGVNDFIFRLMQDTEYTPVELDQPGVEEDLLRKSFTYVPEPGEQKPWKQTGYGRLIERLQKKQSTPKPVPDLVQDKIGNSYVKWRKYRQDSPKILNEPPNLESALEEFARNIDLMIDLAQARSVRIIFSTQPSLWHDGMSKAEEDLLWMGGIGFFQEGRGTAYYSASALSKGMDLYNQKLIEVCRRRGIEWIDLAAQIPKSTAAFYDDVHFNENGARLVAHVIEEYLKQEKGTNRHRD